MRQASLRDAGYLGLCLSYTYPSAYSNVLGSRAPVCVYVRNLVHTHTPLNNAPRTLDPPPVPTKCTDLSEQWGKFLLP